MNMQAVSNLLGRLLALVGLSMLLPLFWALHYQGPDIRAFILSIIITVGAGVLLCLWTKSGEIGHREGFAVAALGWVLAAAFGSLPFILAGSCSSFADAYFETMSGFTTTGATILTSIETEPRGILFWRSLTQWLGGMGIVVLFVAVFPKLGGGGYQLFRAEVPGLSADRLLPRITETAKALWVLYLSLTLVLMVLLMLGGMDLYDALNHSFTTMATGGYSTRNASIRGFNSPYIEGVITVFILISATNFTLLYHVLRGNGKVLLQDAEFRFYGGMILVATVLVTLSNRCGAYGNIISSLRYSAFQVVAIMTGTGFTSANYELWPTLSKSILLVLMFMGGCGGSTTGGMKQIRILVCLKYAYRELYRLVHPRAVVPLRIGGRVVPEPTASGVMGFCVFYVAIFVIGTLTLTAFGLDIESSMGAVAATLGNVGPGLGRVGPAENYGFLSGPVKLLLSLLMLFGRLEIFTVLLLFTREFHRVGYPDLLPRRS
ncbi:MAG: TrkH family potassium uptake protein [Firmicutes bacterium]|nr:TrkH family potassium uptake protein [Bacillota bacterium]